MLGKLIKHEWKGTYKIGCLMLFIMVLITFFGWLAFQSPMWQSLSGESGSSAGVSLLDFFSILTLMFYIFMLVGVSYGILIYLSVHFYKTMYTDEGYLTHTLPVTKHQILGSKILVSGLWYMFIILAELLSVFILGASLVAMVIPADFSLAQIWTEIAPEMDEVFAAMKAELGFDMVQWLIMMVLAVIVSPFSALTIIFGAISMGQLFAKHRVLMAIVCYIGVMVVNMLVSSLLQGVTSIANYSEIVNGTDMGTYMNVTMYGSLILSVAMAVGLYFVSYFVTGKKLNME